MPDAGTHSPAVTVARSRWRAAEDHLYPTLLNDPSSYQRVIATIQAVVAELRRRCGTADELIALEAAPGELLAAACPAGTVIPSDLLLGAACSMADREIAAERERHRRVEIVEAARAAGQVWVVLSGPEKPEAVTEGRRIALHLPSGTLLEATADPWSGGDPYRIDVAISAADGRPTVVSRAFGDRTDWLAALRRYRADIEAAPTPDAVLEIP
ncbi:hypothetical protein [Pseudonocardia asaccharolytica]|uniref:Uncharacterized protein n=1 Tax=Pseudonocardia asaccharolytica DSM 44247 = NBRC 16224 TaxID=1123024 RepID=A0A511D8S7_9PSEU|nr:hypothetical protein [Pseudonocardia asaccharolytica]GEL21007.1 hypothetical protein PA7_48440 [Pseudonocardia asaccharolytica DSM 44247 = NBRC 16224]